MICPQCQTENRSNAKFCDECGCLLVSSSAQTTVIPGSVDPRAALKSIPVVEEADEGFDFSEPSYAESSTNTSGGVQNRESLEHVARDMFPGKFDSGKVSPFGSPDKSADLTGLEKLVDSSYVPPAFSGRAGDTMEMPPVKAEHSQARQYRAELTPKEQKRLDREAAKAEGAHSPKIYLFIFLFVALVAAGIAAGTYYLEIWGGKSIPDVVGQSEENARYTLESRGFTVRAELVKSDDVDGIVLLTDPASGSRAQAGSEVVMHISTSRIVPKVVGLLQEEAEVLLRAEGFNAFTFVPVKSNDNEGLVLSIDVEQGERALSNTPMTIEVAVPYTVPAVESLTQSEAIALLEAEGYKVVIRPHYSEEMKEGIAVSTEPQVGMELKSGETVTLYVSKSRARELIDLTWSYLSSASDFSINGLSYQVSSIDSIEYTGENTVTYTITARYYETHYWFGFEAETRYGDFETLTGTITWSDSNEISGANPTIKRL